MNTITLSALDLSTKSANESQLHSEEKTIQFLQNVKGADFEEGGDNDDQNDFEDEDEDEDNTHEYDISDMSNERLKEQTTNNLGSVKE